MWQMSILSGNKVHQFNLNTLKLDKELESSKIDLLLLPSEIKKHGIVGAQWHTDHGPNVCPLCQSLDGETIPVGSSDWGRVFPPLHLLCHCMLSYPTADERGIEERLRRYRPVDPELFKKWTTKLYTREEIKEMVKARKEFVPFVPPAVPPEEEI